MTNKTDLEAYSDADSSDNSSQSLPKGARSRARGSTSGSRVPTTALTAVDDDVASGVEGELHVKLLLVGGVVSSVLPVTGTTIVVRSEMASHAIVEVLKDHPKRFKQLQKILSASKYADLVLCTASLVVALGVDMRVMPVQSFPVQSTIPDVLNKIQEMMERNAQAQRSAGDTATSPNGQTEHPQSSNLFDSPAVMTEEDAIAAGFYNPPRDSNGG